MTHRIRFALLAFAGALLCGEAAARLPHADAPVGTGVLLGLVAGQLALGLIGVAAAAAVPGDPPAERLGLRRSRLAVPGTVLAVVGFVAFSHGVHLVLGMLALRERGSLARIDRVVGDAAVDPTSLGLALLAVAVVPGVVEELLFRGLVLRSLRTRMGPVAAVALAAAAFGAFHLDWVHGTAAGLLGLYLGALAVRADGVGPPIACHVANNLLGVTAIAARTLGAPGTAEAAWLLPVLAAIAAAGLWAAWRMPDRPRPEG